MKWVSWWIILIISMIPYQGVQIIFYLFHFLVNDKNDQYQLLLFILKFKKAQFITQGIIAAVLGYFYYFKCVNLNPQHKDEAREGQNPIVTECRRSGPGSEMNFFYDIGIFFLQIILVWIAFFLIPCSKQKGRPLFKFAGDKDKQKHEDGPRAKGCCCCSCNRGGLLRVLMIFDLFAFCIAVTLFVVSWLYMNNYTDGTAYLYFGKLVYGLCSAPFVLFLVQPIANVLAKTKPTGYDEYGNTVPIDTEVTINYAEEYQKNFQFKVDIDEMILESSSDEDEKKDISKTTNKKHQEI